MDAPEHNHGHGPPHIVRLYWIIFVALMALLGVTIVLAALDLAWANLPIALTIAGVKAALVVLYFMHVRFATRLTWVFAMAAFLWLGIMLVLTMSDYASRRAVPRADPMGGVVSRQ